jgi:hypothetical protein
MTIDDDFARRMRDEADEIYRIDQLPEEEQPPHRASVVSHPNFAASKVVDVRLTEATHAALVEIAAEKGAAVSDVIRAAVSGYLRQRRQNG